MLKKCHFIANPDACNNRGGCSQSPAIGADTAATIDACRWQCGQKAGCQYFTWFLQDSQCVLFSDCTFDAGACENCFTGAVDCTSNSPYDVGVCTGGTLLDFDYLNNADDCLLSCKANPQCKWFGFNPDNNNMCSLTSDCPAIETSCISAGCVYGTCECEGSSNPDMNIMVTTGQYVDEIDESEVIDKDAITTCPNIPAKYPVKIDFAVGLKHNNLVVICGGAPSETSDCYSYYNDRWTLEPFTLEPGRSGAMSAEVRPGEWLVLGGYGGEFQYLRDTQYLRNGIFTPGPLLPEPISGGSAVMLNTTHLFVAAGSFRSSYPYNSPQNYLLDINTEQWTRIANRTLEPSNSHSSGTFYNSTAGEIQVANIGETGIEVYSPRDDAWHAGIPFPPPISFLMTTAAVQQGSDSFVLIGGDTDQGITRDIYSFDENGLSILKSDVLSVPRSCHVAIPFAKDDFACN